MTWVHAGVGYFLLATGKKTIVDAHLPWYLEYPTDVASTAFAVHPRTAVTSHRIAAATGRNVIHGSRYVWGSRAGLAARSAAATATMYASAVMVGYAIGAVAGTALSQQLFGDQGARDAIDFYSGGVSWSQYWDTVGNLF